VNIIKHPCEVDGKSTAAHAAILAPHDVTVYHFPDIPDYTSLTKVIFLFIADHEICGVYPILSVYRHPFSTLMLFIGQQEGHSTCKITE